MASVYLTIIIPFMIRLATINVNGMAEHHKRVKVFKSLRATNFDVFMV